MATRRPENVIGIGKFALDRVRAILDEGPEGSA